jgi:hypothetical protein
VPPEFLLWAGAAVCRRPGDDLQQDETDTGRQHVPPHFRVTRALATDAACPFHAAVPVHARRLPGYVCEGALGWLPLCCLQPAVVQFLGEGGGVRQEAGPGRWHLSDKGRGEGTVLLRLWLRLRPRWCGPSCSDARGAAAPPIALVLDWGSRAWWASLFVSLRLQTHQVPMSAPVATVWLSTPGLCAACRRGGARARQ